MLIEFLFVLLVGVVGAVVGISLFCAKCHNMNPSLLNGSVVADVLVKVLPQPFPGLDFPDTNACCVVNKNCFIL
jgi:hypothetical protein